MSLRGDRSDTVEPAVALAGLRPWLAAARETALMLTLAAGVCLAWPQVPQSLLLATRIALYYCFSPR